MLIVHQDRRAELYCLGDDGAYTVTDEDDGWATSPVLEVRLTTLAGPGLRIDGGDSSAEI